MISAQQLSGKLRQRSQQHDQPWAENAIDALLVSDGHNKPAADCNTTARCILAATKLAAIHLDDNTHLRMFFLAGELHATR